ncbi:hypothetical protein KM043_006458 [Ampulex compressa]|nr:hypothetical protein KM043_006458 [Ampulex compressa]
MFAASIEANLTNNDVTETQYATCKIVTEELVANAHATVTKVLTGSCSAKAIDEKFEQLEKKLAEKLEEIKSLLYTALEEKKDSLKCGKWKDVKNAFYTDFDRRRLTEINVSPRQYEIDRCNNTFQEISSITGQFINYTFTIFFRNDKRE